MSARELHFDAGDRVASIHLEQKGDTTLAIIDGSRIPLQSLTKGANRGRFEVDGRLFRYAVARDKDRFWVWLNGRTWVLRRTDGNSSASSASAASSEREVKSLMPGKVLRVQVRVGEAVAEKQTLVVMESMTMETALTAPRAGVVASIGCSEGQTVDLGQTLVVLE